MSCYCSFLVNFKENKLPIQTELGQGAESGILLDVGRIQLDALVFVVIPDVLVLVRLSLTPLGPPGGFLFYLQEGVYVGAEQSSVLGGPVVLGGLVPMVHLVHLDHAIALFYSLRNLGRTPRTHERPFRGSMDTRFQPFFVGAGTTEGKLEFAIRPVRQYGMVQSSGRHYFNFGDTEVRPEIITDHFDDLGLTHWVPTVLVDVRVQTVNRK